MKSPALLLAAWLACGIGNAADSAKPPAKPTFTKDVSRILYERCVYCHRPNDIAPIARVGEPLVRPRRLIAPAPDAPGFG